MADILDEGSASAAKTRFADRVGAMRSLRPNVVAAGLAWE
jgi:hypothetical protein